MKYFYIIKEYIQVGGQSLAYIYKFDKKGTSTRIAILLIFPIIANVLNIANAHLADNMQKSFGTGLMAYVLPIFLMVVGIEIVDELFTYLHRKNSWFWGSQIRMLLNIERQKKRANFTLPFIDSKDFDELRQRIEYNGAGFNSQFQLLNSIPDFFRIFVNVIFTFYIVANFNYVFALILLLTTLPKFAVTFAESFTLRRISDDYLTYQRKTGQYEWQFEGYITLKDTKSSGAGPVLLDIYRSRREFYRDIQYTAFKKFLNFGLGANLITLVVGFMIQYFVIKDVVGGTILIGQATLVIAQTFRLQNIVGEFSNFLPQQYENIVSAKYLFLYLSTKENTEKTDSTVVTTTENSTNTSIEMKNILFTYPEIHFKEMRKLIGDMDTMAEKFFGVKKKEVEEDEQKPNNFTLTIPSLTIKTGERVAIVGKNGNGKTTFLQLVLNLYQPDQGEIKIFGNDLKDMSQSDAQKYFSTLFQDYGQTNFRVHEYIGLSDINNPDMTRIENASKIATASDFIEKWKDTYTQQLGISFKGVKPSKGQWQKLALARALYKNAPILVLDEPTSAIDAVSAKKIFENLAAFDSEKILLFVCHNMVDIPLVATRILVFEDGKIVGDGTHAELMKNSPAYKELYESETRG